MICCLVVSRFLAIKQLSTGLCTLDDPRTRDLKCTNENTNTFYNMNTFKNHMLICTDSALLFRFVLRIFINLSIVNHVTLIPTLRSRFDVIIIVVEIFSTKKKYRFCLEYHVLHQ